MSFNLETFVSSPSLEGINGLKKADLLLNAHHYKLKVSKTVTKAQLKNQL